MSKSKLILLVSSSMDNNKKESRDEHRLVRVPSVVREHVDLHEDKVEVWPTTSSTKDRIEKALMLKPFHAFKSDVARAKKMVENGDLTEDQFKRIGFVTTKTFNKICGGAKSKKSIWVSKDIEDTVIGTDPEFLLFDDNKVVMANRVLTYQGDLGCDGAMAEIRPKPSVTVEDHIENIRTIFDNKKFTKAIEELRWLTQCYHKDKTRDYPVGGHIHVGNPKRLMAMNHQHRNSLYLVLNKMLDELLAVPMVRFDGKQKGSARRIGCSMGKYGWYGGLRTDLGRLEHRTLSGMWLLHPSVARAVLGTAKAIIDSVFKLVESHEFSNAYILPEKLRKESLFGTKFNRWGDIPLAKDMGCTTSSKKMTDLINGSATEAINKTYVKNWLEKMRKLPAFEKYRNYIEGLAEMLRLNIKEIDSWDKEIKSNWLGKKKFVVDL